MPPPPRPALFVDLDGTVRTTRWGARTRCGPGTSACVRGWRPPRRVPGAGYVVVGVTNQGGVAMGFLTEADVQAINRRLTEELAPGLFDLVLYCPYHPRGRVAPTAGTPAASPGRDGLRGPRPPRGPDRGLADGGRPGRRPGFAREAGIPSFSTGPTTSSAPRGSGGEPAPVVRGAPRSGA